MSLPLLDATAWLDALRSRAERHSVVFLQLGSAFDPFRDALLNASFQVETLTAYLNNAEPRIGYVAITEIEEAGSATPSVSLNLVRERINADVEAGAKFVLVSRRPRIAFPDVPGSSLLEDARFMHGPLLDDEQCGSDPAQILPACRYGQRDLSDVMYSALEELGLEVCASLDRALFESMLMNGDEALSTLSAREFEALEGAGIARVNGDRSWSVQRRLGELREALASTLAAQVVPPRELHTTMEGLWIIERSVRRAIRAQAQTQWGAKWRQQVLNGDLGDRVLERATESAYAAAKSLAELRDPLEWLTLGELLGIRERPEIGDLGVEKYLWKQFGAAILPVRNRLMHMRLLQPQDPGEVVKWRRVLERKLQIGVPRGADEGIEARTPFTHRASEFR